MRRAIITGAGMSMAAGLAALAAMDLGGPSIDLTPAKLPPRPQPRFPEELTRKQWRAADRSKKQYLLKGVRP